MEIKVGIWCWGVSYFCHIAFSAPTQILWQKMYPWHDCSGRGEISGRREEFLTHECLKYRHHSCISYCWLYPLAFISHNDFNNWLGILRVDQPGFRGWRRQPDGPLNILQSRLWVMCKCLWKVWIFHIESLLAIMAFLFLWRKVKRGSLSKML